MTMTIGVGGRIIKRLESRIKTLHQKIDKLDEEELYGNII